MLKLFGVDWHRALAGDEFEVECQLQIDSSALSRAASRQSKTLFFTLRVENFVVSLAALGFLD